MNASQNGILVLAANRQQVRFFQAAVATAPLSEFAAFTNEDTAASESELHRHSVGHSTNSASGRHTSLASRQEGHRSSDEAFIKGIAARVEELRVAGSMIRLHLVADPRMLGLLRHSLSKDCARLVASETSRDPGHDDAAAVRHCLPKTL